MLWMHYRLVFRLESPLHIGWRKVGNLMQTRRYVPGKVLWAAFTARIVQMASRGNDPKAYKDVGETLKHCFRFGYLWPAHAEKEALPETPSWPWTQESIAYWDYLYLNGTVRTALNPDEHTASEGLLHQIEYIAPHTRENEPVYLIGDLWVRSDLNTCLEGLELSDSTWREVVQNTWQSTLQTLQLGGERGYGWGRVRLVKTTKSKATSRSLWDGTWHWEEENGEIVLTSTRETRLPTHALAADFTYDNRIEHAVFGVEGPVEPWLGWERTNTGYQISIMRLLYKPGSRLKSVPFRLILHTWGYLYTGTK